MIYVREKLPTQKAQYLIEGIRTGRPYLTP
jgi:hypothetical protein